MQDKSDEKISYSNEVISINNNSLKLWLEFEETSGWNDLFNDFANVVINMLDGRRYGINVWTFKFLETSVNIDSIESESQYQIPPDLFVKELTRNCIIGVLGELFKEGELEEILNQSIFDLNFIEPYWEAIKMEESLVESIIKELKLELYPNHVLFNQKYELIAKRSDNDDIVLELEDGRIALVHLSWISKQEQIGFPRTKVYINKLDFWRRKMKQDIEDYA